MNWERLAGRILFAAWCGLCLTGCWDTGDTAQDEQKEPNYVRGKNLMASQDYPGALAALEKALEVNPHNASAHFELFALNESYIKDYPAAIYHGKRFLSLNPQSERTPLVQEHILRCQTEMVKDLPLAPVTPLVQRDIEKRKIEIEGLRRQIENLIQKLALATNRPPMITNVIVTQIQAVVSTPLTAPANRTAASAPAGKSPTPRPAPAAPAAAKTHTVKARETLSLIARQYGVNLLDLQKANPGLNPRKMREGQTIKIPASRGR